MTAWAFILTPFLVLLIVLLFRFVGCGLDVVGTAEPPPQQPKPEPPPASLPPPSQPPSPPPSDGKPPNYRKYILGEANNPGTVKNPMVVPNGADVIAYWRLVDAPTANIAIDEKKFQDGQYIKVPPLAAIPPTTAPPNAARGGSESAPGDFLTAQPGLITSDPGALCRFFQGGHVRVPFKAGLYADEFTIEAWILPRPQIKKDIEYMLFDAGGRYGSPVSDRGFRVFEDRNGNWQVRLLAATAGLYATPPAVPRPGRTHFALVMENDGPGGIKKKVTIYLDGKSPTPALTAYLNSYTRPDGADLFIGIENVTQSPTGAKNLRSPVMSRIQEVVLHKKALSQQEIENHVDINR
ncbi:MAG: LamG-like jellyroll fold domain-containing protein [Desulfobacterales bacterium]